ncbi:hypothetical protein SteCoe_31931 [Stentor coeruleus]|uniref:Uncharacterized protein n=1 Tax=Stentor coeruleus TaxID=5963 RepID=A0A1R2B069_9CILI|nr:hypothetical protein SteCoe_31931 [Stentor coeruleus]
MAQGLNTKQNEEVIISYNKLAMEQLKQENYENSISYLKQALIGIKVITENQTKNKLMVITYNNFGCLFKRMSDYPKALKFLFKAVEFGSMLPDELATLAGAHLNICSIYSQQQDHVKAVKHGLKSIFLLKNIFKEQPKHLPTMIIAYHNVGTEYQLMGQIENAENCLKVGYKISSQFLGPQNNLTSTMKNALNSLIGRGKSPKYDYFTKFDSPKIKLPTVKAKSRSANRENRKNWQKAYVYDYNAVKPTKRNSYLKKINMLRNQNKFVPEGQIPNPLLPKSVSNEEISCESDKSFTSQATSSRKIDLDKHKATEKFAAIMIQSFWRGYKARRIFKELKLSCELKKAEQKARRAVENYEKLKQMMSRLKAKSPISK